MHIQREQEETVKNTGQACESWLVRPAAVSQGRRGVRARVTPYSLWVLLERGAAHP